MEKICIGDRLPELENCGTMYLCVIKVCDIFQEYELCEWFDPICNTVPLSDRELDDMPYFIVGVKYSLQQQLDRKITHWIQLPELKYRLN